MISNLAGMKQIPLHLEILEKTKKGWKILISDTIRKSLVYFDPDKSALQITGRNDLSNLLLRNRFQLKRIFVIKRKETFYPGFQLCFSINDRKDSPSFHDRTKILVVDKRYAKEQKYAVEIGKCGIYEAFTDGCFLHKKKQGAFAVLIKCHDGSFDIYTEKSDAESSSLLELQAAIKAVELVPADELRIISDSFYIRKGLAEWVDNWKINDWYTANGEKVKNVDYWIRLDNITVGKYIEFKWVKAHSGYIENAIADYFAKKRASDQILP